jgi:hypothetical protein
VRLSFECPNVDEDRALITLRRAFALVLTSDTWPLKVIPRSKVSPRILDDGVTGIRAPERKMSGWYPYSWLKGVTRVRVDFWGETVIRLESSHLSNL